MCARALVAPEWPSYNHAMPSLRELLVASQLLSEQDLASAEREAQRIGRRLAPTLVDLGMLSADALAGALVRLTNLAIVDPLPADVPVHIRRKIPASIARELELVPLSTESGVLRVAMIDPSDDGAIEILRQSAGMKVEPVIGLRGAVAEAVDRMYPEDIDVDVTLFVPSAFRLELDSDGEGVAPTPPPAEPQQPAPVESEPERVFEVGNETLFRSFAQPLAITDAEESPVPLAADPGADDSLTRLLQVAESNRETLLRIEQVLRELLAKSR